ncbi:DMT family transporter [Jeotgalibaca sp. A127]|uniref:DMT family transporter n=1 Tax=Jeotgalibaca sp. A127 TaxID=3457324 RepID=UPI003FD69948
MNNRIKGILLAAFGGSMWGISGIFAQSLFTQYTVSSEWLVGTRLLFSGIMILAYSHFIQKENILMPFSKWQTTLKLLFFSLFGMIGVQYLFYKGIELSNASTATILQFSAPIFVYAYMVFTGEKQAAIKEIILVFLTFFGVLLIVTNGDLNQMSISPLGLVIGIGSALAVAFYSIQPRSLLEEFGSTVIVGWGMIFGGILFQFIHPIWKPGFQVTLHSLFLLLLIIVFGTSLSFIAYFASLRYISPSLASIMTALEPLLAAILSVVVFKQLFGIFEMLGIAIVMLAVLVLATSKEPDSLDIPLQFNENN